MARSPRRSGGVVLPHRARKEYAYSYTCEIERPVTICEDLAGSSVPFLVMFILLNLLLTRA